METGSDMDLTSSHNINHQKILAMQLPDYRAAYSDRLAWLMACFSELSYLKFNEFLPGNVKQYFLDELNRLVEADKLTSPKLQKLKALINASTYDHHKERQKLEKLAGNLNYSLLKTFNDDATGTQAILAGNSERLVLAFRGTETDSYQDIKADADAATVPCASNGKVHGGFHKSYNAVYEEIEQFLKNEPSFTALPLFITGHSLGGALATIAAKRLTHSGGIAACFTFGSPRVGDEDWISAMKAPLYRIVNAADVVTMLPPSKMGISVLAYVCSFIPVVGHKIQFFIINKYGGYLHGGNMRYMTNCPTGDFKDVKILYSVSLVYRIKGMLYENLPWTNLLSDHKIATYRRKLETIAIKRNE